MAAVTIMAVGILNMIIVEVKRNTNYEEEYDELLGLDSKEYYFTSSTMSYNGNGPNRL
jgi:hypothetical protein